MSKSSSINLGILFLHQLYCYFNKTTFLPAGKFSWSSKFSSHTVNILVSGPTIKAGCLRMCLIVTGASWGDDGLSLTLVLSLLSGLSVVSSDNDFGLVRVVWSVVWCGSCGDLSGGRKNNHEFHTNVHLAKEIKIFHPHGICIFYYIYMYKCIVFASPKHKIGQIMTGTTRRVGEAGNKTM